MISINILAFYIGNHDSNISIVKNGEVYYYKPERIFQIKHMKASIEWVKELCDKMNFFPEIVCFSDGNRNNLGCCDHKSLFQEVKSILYDVPTICVDHHYAHILSAWMIEKSQTADYGISIDGRGDHNSRISIIEKPFQVNDSRIIMQTCDYQYCLMFQEIGEMMGLKGLPWDHAGKIMGLQAYGKANTALIEKYRKNGFSQYPLKILKRFYNGTPITNLYSSNKNLFMDWITSVHEFIQVSIEDIFKTYFLPDDTIVYSGGCAQNTVINEQLSLNYNNLIIPPHCYDGGISLGCVYLISKLFNQDIHIDEFPFSSSSSNLGYIDDKNIESIADLLAKGKIIGFSQGQSEIGPRALGHRSILMIPTLKNGKQILNDRIKKREFWRPFAASILEEDLSKFTDSKKVSPYMLYAIKTLPDCKSDVPAVIHEDGTCRFQTVANTAELNSFRNLLQIMKLKYNIPMLLNTSLNINGMPIARTYNDCLNVFKETQLDAICIGNEIFIKK